MTPLHRLSPALLKGSRLLHPAPSPAAAILRLSTYSGDDEWNDAWETAWLPEDLSGKNRAPWERDVNFSLSEDAPQISGKSQTARHQDMDSETRAFVEEMNENWDQRKGKSRDGGVMKKEEGESSSLYSLENIKKDYRLKKQRIHAGLWVKEIEKMEEAKLGDSFSGMGDGDSIDQLLDSCSEIFDLANTDFQTSKASTSEFKNRPDGWETISKTEDGNIWEMSQREEDILLQEFERRIAFNKFQIASFIKTHIFSRRRPIDGWKYMIEEIGPNAKRGKGSVSRLPSLADPSTQPFGEEKISNASTLSPRKGG